MPLFFVPEYHNTNGPLKITETAYTRVADIFLNGGKELGYKIHDCNGNDGDQEGICDLLKKILFKIDVFVNTLTLDYMHVLNSILYVLTYLPFLSVLRVLQASDVYRRRATVKYSSKFFNSCL